VGDAFDRRASTLLDSLIDAAYVDEEASAARDEMLALLRELVATALTARQRQIIDLYFTDGLSQAQIATSLGISQQVVSKQLFGVMREGRRVGGAIRRLRQLCEEHGIDPQRWV
jgi:RNA polymerase sigma factor (sigma-70 family)